MTDVPPLLQAALADRYRIDRELGAGGMATVYLATDLRHQRSVAIKVLRPELAGAIGPERFLREIETAARLSHPHILPLFDSAEAAGHLFYIMPYVAGESLRQRLEREGPLPIGEAVEITRQVASALEHAHQQGVVHRDIKPENILLQEGQAIVADFGIARAIDAAGDSAAGGRLTQTGLVIGTPRYMSPEQIAGAGVTGRSDVYSLGCVLYEMLTGAPPFDGPTAQAVLGAHTVAPVPPPRRRRPEVSRALETTVLAALAKRPEERIATAALLTQALAGSWAPRRAGAGSRAARAAVLVFAGLALVLGIRWRLGTTGGSGRGVAVLYLDNLSRDSSVQYLADGLTEEMISRLSQVGRLAIPSRGAVRRYRGRAVDDPAGIGRALGVSHFVSGSIESGGDARRVRVALVEAATGRQVWGAAFSLAEGGDVFAMEDSIAHAVTGAVIGRLAATEARALAARPTAAPEAYDHYLRGNFYLSQRTSEADGRRALQEYQAALTIDPDFAPAQARLGLVYGIYASWPWDYPGLSTDSLLARGMVAANRAIELDSGSADGWLARGFLLIPTPADADAWAGFRVAPNLILASGVCWSGVPDCRREATASLARAVELTPRNAEAWYQFGRAQSSSPASDSALERSLALEPDRAVSAWLLGWHYLVARRLPQAETMLDSAIGLGRKDRSVYSLRLETRLARGDTRGAVADLGAYGRMIDGDSIAEAYHTAMRIAIDSRLGDRTTARVRTDSLLRRFPPDRLASRSLLTVLAAALVAAGDSDRGLALLERMAAGSGAAYWRPLANPLWDPVRADPRFRRIEEHWRAPSN
jgi:serine/threonine-protein kinase